MKKFTIIASLLLVLLFGGMVVYVATSEDFVAPEKEEKPIVEENMDAPVWDETVESLVSYLSEKDLIDVDSEALLASSGFCSESVWYSGAEIYWWDVENLDEKSDEYKAYESLKTKGEIDLYNSGTIIMPESNGPFALLLNSYEGDVEALKKAFMEFGQE